MPAPFSGGTGVFLFKGIYFVQFRNVPFGRHRGTSGRAVSPKGDTALLHHFISVQAVSPEGGTASLLHHFICTATRSKCMRLGPEGKTHPGDIAHGIAQRIVAFKRRIGVDVGMNFQINPKPVEQRA